MSLAEPIDMAREAAPVPDTAMPIADARRCVQAMPGSPLAILLGWTESYLMAPHADLGRTGAVCPFTRQAARLDTVRLGINEAGPAEEERVFALVREAFATLEAIPVKPGMEHFRTVIIGFPGCATEEGVAMLARVQKRNRFFSLRRGQMIGLMHASSEAPGLWNPEFRPLRAPLPVLAVRHLVEHDAPFAARHPLLLLPSLARFPVAGTKRLVAHVRGGR